MTGISGFRSTFRPAEVYGQVGKDWVSQNFDKPEYLPEKGLTRYPFATPIEIPNSGRIFKNYITKAEIVEAKDYSILNIFTKQKGPISYVVSKNTEPDGFPKYFLKDAGFFEPKQISDITNIVVKKIMSMDRSKAKILAEINSVLNDAYVCKNHTKQKVATRRVIMQDTGRQHFYSVIAPGTNMLQSAYIIKNKNNVELKMDGLNGRTYNCIAELNYNSPANIEELYSYGIPNDSGPYMKPLTPEEKADMINTLTIIRAQAETNQEYKDCISAIVKALG